VLSCADPSSWECGFESRWDMHVLSLESVLCCQVEVPATGQSLAQRSPTECGVSECGVSECSVSECGVSKCGVSECDLETSIMKRPWHTKGCYAMK
jgi:hypothetical protein